MIFNGCPKCSGTLQWVADEFGPYWRCVVCGLLIDPETADPPMQKGARGASHSYKLPSDALRATYSDIVEASGF